MITLKDYISPQEAADLLEITVARVYQLLDEGKFTRVIVAGRIALFRAEVERLAAQRQAK